MKIALIIFTRNELKNSQKIYRKIPFKKVDATYIIDGNSTDGTADFWKNKKIKIYGQKYKGVGGAYESAFSNTREEALIFFHPDGNMNPEEIEKFVEYLKKGNSFIVASRNMKGALNEEDESFLKQRKWSTQLMAFVINFIWGSKKNNASDLTQGYRAITRKAYLSLKIKIPSAVAPDTEQIIRALKAGIVITEFPTQEGARVYGETSMKYLGTSRENIKVFLKELFKK